MLLRVRRLSFWVGVALVANVSTAEGQQLYAAGAVSFVYPTGWKVAGTMTDPNGLAIYPDDAAPPVGSAAIVRGIQLSQMPRPQGGSDDQIYFRFSDELLPRRYPGLKATSRMMQSLQAAPGIGMTSVLQASETGAELGYLTTLISRGTLYIMTAVTLSPREFTALNAVRRMIWNSLSLDGTKSPAYMEVSNPRPKRNLSIDEVNQIIDNLPTRR
jgi:hypothetical protein